MPETNKISTLAKESWNKGVLSTFRFIADLPETVNEWSAKGADKVLQNQDIKNFVESFSKNSSTK